MGDQASFAFSARHNKAGTAVRADWHASLFPLYGYDCEPRLARQNPIHKPTLLQLVKDTA
jgi:hypothetical protein